MKECENCKNSFKPRKAAQICCSNSCGQVLRNKLNPPTRKTKNCKACKMVFRARPAVKQCCSRKCASKLKSEKNLKGGKKFCKAGNHFADFSEFTKSSKRLHGISSICRKCKSEKYQANSDVILQKQKQYRERNGKEKEYEKTKRWTVANKEKSRAIKQAYRERHPERIKQQGKKYYLENKNRFVEYSRNHPEFSKAATARRRAKIKNAGGSFTAKQFKEKLDYWKNCCYLCGETLKNKKINLEHRIPISRGGTNWLANIAPACEECNLKKGVLTEREYRNKLSYSTPQT